MNSAETIDAKPVASAFDALLRLDQSAWDAIPQGAALVDADGKLVRFNRRAELFRRRSNVSLPQNGKSRGEFGETTSSLIRHALEFGAPVTAQRETISMSDGSKVEIASDVEVLRGANSDIQGALYTFRELTAPIARHEREHLASIVEYSDDAIISKDLNGIVLSWNKGAERLFGYTEEEAIGQSITMLIPDQRLDEEPQILGRIRGGERIDHYETVRRRKDGTLVDISLTVSPMRNAHGEIVAASKIARDISERNRAEARRSLLMAELNHRVKNALATVISIARQSFAGAEVGEARAVFDARIRGLAQTHGRLADSNWESVPLRALFSDEIAPYRQSGGSNVSLDGPHVDLSPKCALTLGLAIHELVTNAAKYGALSKDTGAVDIAWNVDTRDHTLEIKWSESGGPAVSSPQRSGFGRLLLERALVSDLGSEVQLDFDPAGLQYRIRIPELQYSARA
ncbi:MAG TPA: PAS domain S-box protein [Rhizomicrobium sp.]|nr:PAS domain S-box protein [Rhizomicrobium sp.]